MPSDLMANSGGLFPRLPGKESDRYRVARVAETYLTFHQSIGRLHLVEALADLVRLAEGTGIDLERHLADDIERFESMRPADVLNKMESDNA